MIDKFSELKERVPILDLCKGLGIGLSSNYMAKCPFGSHVDKTPSFKVYPDSNSFYCFGCEKGGDTIILEKLFYNLPTSFEAAKKISDDYNIKIFQKKLTLDQKRKIKLINSKQKKVQSNIKSFEILRKKQYNKLFSIFKTLSEIAKIPKLPQEKGSELYAFAKSELNNLTDYHKNGESWSQIEEYLESHRCGDHFNILKEYENIDMYIHDLYNRWNKMTEGISNNEL